MDTDNQEAPPSKKQKLEEEITEESSEKVQDFIDFSEDVTEAQEKDFSMGEDIYSNFTDPEEMQRLREFKVLDEVKSNDENSDEDSESSDGKSESLPDEELDKMLDEDLPDELKLAPKPKEKAYVTRQKIVLEEKGVNHLEVLPLDWIMARHYSGIPVYIHRTSRVCTLSKPYFLGKGNTRRHEIPISAIPCLAYRRALEEEAKQEDIDKSIQEQIKNGTWKNFTPQTGTSVIFPRDKLLPNNADNVCKNEEQTHEEVIIEQCVVNSQDTIRSDDSNEQKCPFTHKATDGIQIATKADSKSDLEPKENTEISSFVITNNMTKEENELKTLNLANNETGNDTNSNEFNIGDESKMEFQDNSLTTTSEVNNTVNIDHPTEASETVATLEDIPLNRRPVVLPGGIVMPPPRIETVNESWKTQHLNHEQVNDYCKKLFKFKTVQIMHFNRWADRRKYTKARKTLQYPTLPEGTKLITIPAQNGQDGTVKAAKRDWVMNMNGRSCLSVFHEYVRRALQKQPVYEFKQLENASCPYQAQVFIGGMQYGVGRGSSKRQAKSHAARHAFHVLLPTLPQHEPPRERDADFTFFDYVGISDPRISEFCAATCEPSPHAILRTCLLRNFGAGDRHIHTEMKKLEYQKIELTMSVGKHKATVVCKNKKTAKQRASQAILQALHPHVTSWGSLLRLYGSRSVKSCKEKKLEEQQITLLQDKARHNEPNYAVLDKLRSEMRRLRERDAALVPIGTLLLQHDLPTHSGSNLNNVDL